MDPNSKRQKRRDDTLSLLNAAIEPVNLAKEVSSVTPANAVFGSVCAFLTMIRVCFISSMLYSSFTRSQDSVANKTDYVDLGLACADVRRALEQGVSGKKLDDLNQPVRETIGQLTA